MKKNSTAKIGPKFEQRIENGETGVAFLEFVIVFPVLMLIFLAFVDFGRYAYTKNIVEAAANRALLLASTIEGLEDEPGAEGSRHEEAKARVEAVALDFVLGTFLSQDEGSYAKLEGLPELVIPKASIGQSIRQVLQSEPMVVEIDAVIVPFLPVLPLLSIKGKSVGFREPSSDVSLPIPVDCLGNPAGSDSFYDYCPCEGANEKWEASTRACKSCGVGGEVRTSGTSCSCSNELCQAEMGPNSYVAYSGGLCPCKCPSGLSTDSAGECSCPEGKNVVGSGSSSKCNCADDDEWTDARCQDEYTPVNAVATSDLCGCKCAAVTCGTYMMQTNLAGGCGCVCWNGNLETKDGGTRCDCKNPETCQNDRFYLNRGDCKCKCKFSCTNGTMQDDCSCKCDDGSVRTSDSCPAPKTEEPPVEEEEEGGASE